MPIPLRFRRLPLVAALAMFGLAILPATGTVPDADPEVIPVPLSVVDLGPGAWLNNAPNLEPLPPEPTIEDIRRHKAAGDEPRAIALAERFVAQHKWGRDRDVTWLMLGLHHREAGRYNLASEAFTKVRAGKGPLASWGAWHEAEQDLSRGRQWVAIRECERYRLDYPAGHHANPCLALIARAHAQLGRFVSARSTAAEYDADNKGAEIGEQIELALATWTARNAPEEAVDHLHKLAISHRAALTGRVAEETLAQLSQQGVAGTAVPTDTQSLKVRAISLRTARRLDDAWAVYTTLSERAEDDPKLAAWVNAEAQVFGWRCRQWDFLADWYGARYDDSPSAELAWDRFRVLERGGRFEEAIAQARVGLEKHGNTKEWTRHEEAIARTYMLGGDYVGARDLLDTTASRGGWTGRRAGFYAAFSAFMAGDFPDAEKRLTAIVDKKRSYHTESLYWRGRLYQATERLQLAEADFATVRENKPLGWYALLTIQGQDDPSIRPFKRDGNWPGADLPTPEVYSLAIAEASAVPFATPTLPPRQASPATFERLSWPLTSQLTQPKPEPVSVVLANGEIMPPPGYQASVWFNPKNARGDFYRFAEANKDTWDWLPAVYDLARIGLYDLSGPLMSEVYEDWRKARNNSAHPHHAAARKLYLPAAEWRQLFLFARDHHHSARFTYEIWDNVEDQEVARQAWRLAYPLAHDQMVWRVARQSGVDPYLVLGLMRQESTYNAIAESRVGARGAMQIMPRTGHLLANLAHDTDFTAVQLADPVLSVSYGIGYLGKLLDRFDGVYPLAVASYNGGCFNVSSWLAGTGTEMPMDAWVEHIPFRETRDYVKKVSGGYSAYIDLYAPEGTRIVLPEHARGNHSEIVDF